MAHQIAAPVSLLIDSQYTRLFDEEYYLWMREQLGYLNGIVLSISLPPKRNGIGNCVMFFLVPTP